MIRQAAKSCCHFRELGNSLGPLLRMLGMIRVNFRQGFGQSHSQPWSPHGVTASESMIFLIRLAKAFLLLCSWAKFFNLIRSWFVFGENVHLYLIYDIWWLKSTIQQLLQFGRLAGLEPSSNIQALHFNPGPSSYTTGAPQQRGHRLRLDWRWQALQRSSHAGPGSWSFWICMDLLYFGAVFLCELNIFIHFDLHLLSPWSLLSFVPLFHLFIHSRKLPLL